MLQNLLGMHCNAKNPSDELKHLAMLKRSTFYHTQRKKMYAFNYISKHLKTLMFG